MRMHFLVGALMCISMQSFGQFEKPKDIQPDSTNFPNIYVKKMFSDDKSSVFIIWVKKDVAAHYHQNHTEVVTVISGKGLMTLGDKEQNIRRGDIIVIPMTTTHAVKTTSKKPLKVMSIQSPQFDGTDRILLK